MKRLPVLLLALFALDQPACVAEPFVGGALNGRVQLTGNIINSACTLHVGNERQTVVFSPASLSGIVSGNSSSQQPLNIYIRDCITSNSRDNSAPTQHFKLTFEGVPEGKSFNIQGSARGIALQIKDERGQMVSPGMILEHSTPANDRLMLNYSVTLVGSGHALEAGDYNVTIKLNLQHF